MLRTGIHDITTSIFTWMYKLECVFVTRKKIEETCHRTISFVTRGSWKRFPHFSRVTFVVAARHQNERGLSCWTFLLCKQTIHSLIRFDNHGWVIWNMSCFRIDIPMKKNLALHRYPARGNYQGTWAAYPGPLSPRVNHRKAGEHPVMRHANLIPFGTRCKMGESCR